MVVAVVVAATVAVAVAVVVFLQLVVVAAVGLVMVVLSSSVVGVPFMHGLRFRELGLGYRIVWRAQENRFMLFFAFFAEHGNSLVILVAGSGYGGFRVQGSWRLAHGAGPVSQTRGPKETFLPPTKGHVVLGNLKFTYHNMHIHIYLYCVCSFMYVHIFIYICVYPMPITR